jgi:hypothetical protein
MPVVVAQDDLQRATELFELHQGLALAHIPQMPDFVRATEKLR